MILVTADGSHTLRHELLGELYHSDRGAMGEALQIYIENGFNAATARNPALLRVLEIGFGTGLNCYLTLERAAELGVTVEYNALELYPIDIETASELNYSTKELFTELHLAIWDEPVDMTPTFTLTKYRTDITTFDFASNIIPTVDLIYFDAFAPDLQPELWSIEIMRKIFDISSPGAILTTYTAKGVVKQALRTAGFRVERLEGALGKRHSIRAIKE